MTTQENTFAGQAGEETQIGQFGSIEMDLNAANFDEVKAEIQMKKAMQKRAQQRNKRVEIGKQKILEKSVGRAVLLREVEIKDRAVATRLFSFYPASNLSFSMLSSFISGVPTEIRAALNGEIDERLKQIQTYNAEWKAKLGALQKNLDQSTNPILPTYADSAFKDTIEISSPKSLALIEVFLDADKINETIVRLQWNDMADGISTNDYLYEFSTHVAALMNLIRGAVTKVRSMVENSNTERNVQRKLDAARHGEGQSFANAA